MTITSKSVPWTSPASKASRPGAGSATCCTWWWPWPPSCPAQPSIALLVIALIIDLVKRGDAEGSWMANHFSWRIRSVIWAGILYLVTAPLWLLFFVPGWIAWTVISIWFLYRIVRGMVAMNRNQAVDR